MKDVISYLFWHLLKASTKKEEIDADTLLLFTTISRLSD